MDIAAEEFKALEAKLAPDLDRDLELFKEEIKGPDSKRNRKTLLLQERCSDLHVAKRQSVSKSH